jgi:UrcA family protein
MRTITSSRPLRTALLAAGALMLAGVSANAQDRAYESGVYDSNENVEINVPRYQVPQDKSGATYGLHSLSQQVRYDDLDLRTADGAYTLRARARLTARLMCQELDWRYPLTTPDGQSCAHISVREATYAANQAIDRERYAANQASMKQLAANDLTVKITPQRSIKTAHHTKNTHYASKSLRRYASND